jgi:hypothetical protein
MIYTAQCIMLLISRAQPVPLAQIMDAVRIKILMHRAVSLVHRWFYVQEPTGDFKGVSYEGFRVHTTPPVRLSNITTLVRLSNISALLPPPSPPSRTYSIRNQRETVRCIKERSGTFK